MRAMKKSNWGGNELQRGAKGPSALQGRGTEHGQPPRGGRGLKGHASGRPTLLPPPTFATGIWGGSSPASGRGRGQEAGSQENLAPDAHEAWPP